MKKLKVDKKAPEVKIEHNTEEKPQLCSLISFSSRRCCTESPVCKMNVAVSVLQFLPAAVEFCV